MLGYHLEDRKTGFIITIAIILLILLAIIIYFSPDEAYWVKEDLGDATKIGRKYAFYLLNNYKQGCLELSIEPAKTKVNELDSYKVSQINVRDLLEQKQLDFDLVSPLISGTMDLMSLDRIDSFIVMTFAYKDYPDKIIEIPEKGKMLFSIAIRYYNPVDNKIIPKLMRKIANLPVLRYVTRNLGTTGRWKVFDYQYIYNRRDYLDWVLKDGENYTREKRKESEEFLKKLKDSSQESRKEIIESSQRGLDFLYYWGSEVTKYQITRIEKLYKKMQEAEK